MCIQFCRSKAAEAGVEEVMPTASAFLGDSSMKYVRLTISCWLSLYLAKVGHWKCIRVFIYLLEIAYIYFEELIFNILKLQPEESEWDDEFGNELYVSDSVPSQPACQAVDDSENKVDEDSKIKALIDTSALDYR